MVRSEEHIQIIAVCDFWDGHGVLRNQTPYYEEVTQLFYANLVFNEDGMSATSYMFGRNIKLSRV